MSIEHFFSVFSTIPPVHGRTSRIWPICYITHRSFFLVLEVSYAQPTTDAIIDNQNTQCPMGVKGRGVSDVKSAPAVPSTVQLGLSVLEPVGRPLDEVPAVFWSHLNSVTVLSSPSFTAGTCWNPFLALPVVTNSVQSSDGFLPRH